MSPNLPCDSPMDKRINKESTEESSITVTLQLDEPGTAWPTRAGLGVMSDKTGLLAGALPGVIYVAVSFHVGTKSC